MQTIKRKTLKEKYGIDLDPGLYHFDHSTNEYTVSTVKDDTQGCLIPGRNRIKGQVVDSRKAFAEIDEWLEKALKTGKVFIKIVDTL